MDNTRYINKDTWEVCDKPLGFIPVDKGIAKTIVLLNQKGYITTSSCEGHHDIRFVNNDEVDIAYLEEFKGDARAIIKRVSKETFDYWAEILGTSIYVVFAENYEWDSIPEGFVSDGDTLRHSIDYYVDKKRREISSINEEIKKYNKILYEWADKLPSINKRKDD